MKTDCRLTAIEAAVNASDAFSAVGLPYREAAATIAALLGYIDATDAQATAFAVELADAMSGGAAEIRHTINGRYVVVDDDGDTFDLCFGGALVAWFRLDGTEIGDLVPNLALLEMMERDVRRKAA